MSKKQVATSVHTQELKTELLDQKCQTQVLNDEIVTQGKTLSAFTVVNILFLPLGFFSQVSTVLVPFMSLFSNRGFHPTVFQRE